MPSVSKCPICGGKYWHRIADITTCLKCGHQWNDKYEEGKSGYKACKH